VAGVKDSSGDWSNTKAMLDAFPGWGIFSGNELVLLENMRGGGVGCISATANINPAAIHRLYDQWESPEAEAMQAEVNALREFMQGFPMIPALKSTVAHYGGDPEWNRLRPPLVELTAEQQRAMLEGLERFNFAMPGLAAKEGAAD
jgi:4-hydroxy-tetrahydrodipicolinate synthase